MSTRAAHCARHGGLSRASETQSPGPWREGGTCTSGRRVTSAREETKQGEERIGDSDVLGGQKRLLPRSARLGQEILMTGDIGAETWRK